MSRYKSRRQKAIMKRRIFLSVCSAALVSVMALTVFIIYSVTKPVKNEDFVSSNQSNESSKETVIETAATVLSTGDIMVHDTQLYGAFNKESGKYDFSAFFKESSEYFKKADLSVANLEVTFGGTQSGKYSGYPAFNTPDELADDIKNSGLNLLLTSNNHSYDTGLYGLKRTAQVLKERGIEFIGTREQREESIYTVKEINGIKIGMANYTYETSGAQGKKYLNGRILSEEANDLVSSFSYGRIEEFYANAAQTITEMQQSGAEFIVFYMHWGEEYQTTQNTWQKTIAQKLCNLGVDIIIGSHPHVIQPIELITSEDSQNTTVCLYSTGNAVSNQRQEIMDSCPSGHTEDGLLFSYTLKKKGNDVTLDSIDLIPTWVNRYRDEKGSYKYTIYPLENPQEDVIKYGLDQTAKAKALKSFERTKAIVAAGLTECQNQIGCEITFAP